MNLKIPDPLDVVLDLLFNLFWHALSHLVSIASTSVFFLHFDRVLSPQPHASAIWDNVINIIMIIISILLRNLLLKNFFGKLVSGGEVFRAARGADPPFMLLRKVLMAVPHICEFLGTTSLFRPVKRTP